MPSPFPGMDPFLERPGSFPDLHESMITYIREALQPRLPEPYFAVIGERLWVEASQRPIGPDVDVVSIGASRSSGRPAGTMELPTRSESIVIEVLHDEQREGFVEIRIGGDEDSEERIVTCIELLSLTNKTPGKGRDLYLAKQREVLETDIHLVEIDLLRGGEHTTAAPRSMILQKVGPFDYHVSLHEFQNRKKRFLVYAVRLEEPLPEIAVPLLPGDGFVPLDLQAVFDRSYDTGPYRRRVRYEPSRLVPPLRPEQLEWVTKRLEEFRAAQ